MSNDYGPSIPIARLFERVSKKGNHYLTGRLGMAKIVILKSEETTDDGTPIWNVLLSEGQPPKTDGDNPSRERRSKPQRPPARRATDADSAAMRDWQRPGEVEIPF